MKRLIFAVVLVAVLVGGSTATTDEARASSSSVVWTPCNRNFDCGTIHVPIDYSKPAGDSLELALIRLPATDQSHKIGSLLVNPGGPGASGVDFVRAWANSLSGSIRQQFDIVGFDPRGIGQSTPIVCHDNLQAFVAADPVPTTQAQWDRLVQLTKDFDNACAQKYGSLLPFLGTKNVVRDLDQIRAAVGDEKLTYLGYSYGTVIGQVYADMFPAKIRALVLDGAVDLSLSGDDKTLTQIAGFELALKNFVADCQQRNCPLNVRTGGHPMAAIDQLLAKVKQAPIPAPYADRPAGPGETFLGLITPLYSKGAWPVLAIAVDSALNGDATQIIRLADSYLDRNPDGSYANAQEANLAVVCLDEAPSKLPVEFKDFPAAAAKFAQASPHFGPAVATGLSCAFWGAKSDPLQPPTATGAPPILIVDTTGDPATPYPWGVSVNKQLKSSVLLTYNGDGHTAYDSGDACIDGAVNAYLISLTSPLPGTECGSKVVTPSQQSPTPSPPATGTDSTGSSSPTAVVAEAGTTTKSGGGRNAIRWIAFTVFVLAAAGAAGVAVVRARRRDLM